MIIADTSIVSEFMKDTPQANVMAWARGLGPTDLAITVVTIEEVERGLGRLPQGRRRCSSDSAPSGFRFGPRTGDVAGGCPDRR